jgi:hypothetical protein
MRSFLAFVLAAATTVGCSATTTRPQESAEPALIIPSLSAKRDEARSHGSTVDRGRKAVEIAQQEEEQQQVRIPDAGEIRSSIKEYLMCSRHLSFGAKRVKVDVAGSAVKMTGRVKGSEELLVVEQVALATEGVSSVDTSQITVQ